MEILSGNNTTHLPPAVPGQLSLSSSRGRLVSSKLHQLVLQLFIQSWRPLANYTVKAGVVYLQVKLCDLHLSALEVRFSRLGAIYKSTFT